MPGSSKPEDLVIRLLKDGRIVIDGTGLPPRRIRELRDTLQEVLGPAVIIDEQRRESPEAPRPWGENDEQAKNVNDIRPSKLPPPSLGRQA